MKSLPGKEGIHEVPTDFTNELLMQLQHTVPLRVKEITDFEWPLHSTSWERVAGEDTWTLEGRGNRGMEKTA